jgi:hypothetical protein
MSPKDKIIVRVLTVAREKGTIWKNIRIKPEYPI